MYKVGDILLCIDKINQYYTIGKRYTILDEQPYEMFSREGKYHQLKNNKGIINWFADSELNKNFLSVKQERKMKLNRINSHLGNIIN